MDRRTDRYTHVGWSVHTPFLVSSIVMSTNAENTEIQKSNSNKKKQLSCADFSIAKKAVDDLREDVICTVIIIADRKNISLWGNTYILVWKELYISSNIAADEVKAIFDEIYSSFKPKCTCFLINWCFSYLKSSGRFKSIWLVVYTGHIDF